MKTKKSFKLMACAGLTGLLLTGCQADDLYNPDLVIEDYENQWKETFGAIDPNQTWNMAKQVTANIALNSDGSTPCNVNIYTANPSTSGSKLLARTSLNGNGSISFDLNSALGYVFVETQQGTRMLTNGYYPVNGNSVTVGGQAQTRASESCPVTRTKLDEGALGTFQDTDMNFNYVFNYVNSWDVFNKNFGAIFDTYDLEGVTAPEGATWKISDWAEIVGKGGVFAERGLTADGLCNLLNWEDKLAPSKGVEYVVSTEGPVELMYMFGGTSVKDVFGYFYYQDGATEEEILSAPRYFWTRDALPQNYITSDGVALTDGMQLPGLVDNYLNADTDHNITGSILKLVYFDENGQASYDFPAGTHIGFFIIPNADSVHGNNIRYSLPWMNKKFYNYYQETHPSWTAADQTQGGRYFVTYSWGDQIIMGLEDTNDDDMNDMLFFVNGDFESKPKNIGPEVAEPNSWILACEDLGATGDFDFNDVVFSVSYVSGETTATITPLAAGGTLPADILYNGNSQGEIHKLLGVATTEFANTQNSITQSASPITITVPNTFTLTSSNWGGFSVKITKDDGATTNVTVPGKGSVPQMICVPGDWQWPKERTNISTAYPDFGTWGENASNNTWYNNVVSSKVIAR